MALVKRRNSVIGCYRAGPTALLAASIASVLLLGGCPGGGYSTWPAADDTKAFGGDTSSNYLNGPPVPQVLGTALNYACRKFPPQADAQPQDQPTVPFAINLPPGTRYRTSQEIVGFTHPMARTLTDETQSLPKYHIASYSVRGSDAEVMVFVPVISMAASDGTAPYKGVRIILRSGLQNWRIMGHSSFPVALLSVPQTNIIQPVPLSEQE